VHTLVAAVSVRLAGLDALNRDAEPEPPDRELGDIEQSIRTGEGDAVTRPSFSSPFVRVDLLRRAPRYQLGCITV
jgi:hypothetical protein